MFVWLALGLFIAARLLLASHWRHRPDKAQRMGGILSAASGALFPILALFLPMWTVTEERAGETRTTTESLWQRGADSELLLIFTVLVSLAIGAGWIAVVDNEEPRQFTLFFLRFSGALLLVASIMAGFTIGWILFPTALVVLATAIQATRNHQNTSARAGSAHSG